jgi:glycerol-3-phosphate dehydrogenase
MGNRSVIGTTDTRVEDPHTSVTDEDRDFLLGQINDRLDLMTPLSNEDVIAERSGVRPLVVRRQSRSVKDVDWTALSRKHEIEVDHAKQVVSIFGGKLTDCLNVGEEVASAVQMLGIHLLPDQRRWYGEPGGESRRAFFRQTRGMRMDELNDRVGSEPLSERLWRRYGRRAFDMLDDIREDPSMAEDVLDSSDYLRVELHNTASTEMVVKLDDFLRRRSKISLITRDEDVRSSKGLQEVADILFGSEANSKLEEHFGTLSIPPVSKDQ